MKNFFLVFAFLYISNTSLHAQKTMSFSEAEKTAFVAVYLGRKAEQPDPNILAESVYKKNGINSDNLKAYHDNPKDSSEKNKIIQLQVSAQDLHDRMSLNITQRLCNTHKISLSKYNKIRSRYKKDIAFQHNLRPYFQTYFKNN